MSDFDPERFAEIRRRLDHPVLDGDGHTVEFIPAVRDELVALAGEEMAQQLDQVFGAQKIARTLDENTLRQLGLFRMSWWAFPTERTIDRAAAMLPGLLYERLPDLGIDFAVLYPTFGLTAPHIDDPDLRRAATRALNRYYASHYAAYAARLTPAAVIPMHSAAEAVEELDFAVGELGLRAAVFAGCVQRPLPGDNDSRAARWVDSFGPDDPTAYDAVWQRCVELGVTPTFHSSSMGWGSRASLTSYVYNHIGNFAAAGEATCRSLFLSGVPQRFPILRFAFLEGGVAWGANLYSDLIGHFEKRGAPHIGQFDPARLDRTLFAELFDRYAPESFTRNPARIEAGLEVLSDPAEQPEAVDEFRHTGIERPEDIREIFTDRFFFGCEADDPMNAIAFDTALNPLQARLRALFSSDIGHWDVPDMRGVLQEAWELVEDERLSEADFREFTFANAVELFTATNPDFFQGTEIESAVKAELG
jgi:predicted TIM-barrel fold metal-dependent hydrolase